MRFVYVCTRCRRVAGIGAWPDEESPYAGRLDMTSRECVCAPTVGYFGEPRDGEAKESTVLRTPAPPFVR